MEIGQQPAVPSTATLLNRAGDKAYGANAVPTLRETATGLGSVRGVDEIDNYFPRKGEEYLLNSAKIFSPKLSPSAVSTEQVFQARSILAPVYMQNMMASKIERISNLAAEAPRFSKSIDILA